MKIKSLFGHSEGLGKTKELLSTAENLLISALASDVYNYSLGTLLDSLPTLVVDTNLLTRTIIFHAEYKFQKVKK